MKDTSPLSIFDVQTMLVRLPQPVVERAAALHLALPVNVAASVAVRQHWGSWTYRGFVVDWTDDAARDAALLAELGHQAGDRYLDPLGDVEGWVKTLRSGTRTVAFGADTLLHSPVLTAEVGVTRPVVLSVLRAHLQGTLHLPVVHESPVGAVLVEGGTHGIHIRSQEVHTEAAATQAPDVAGCGEMLAAELGAESWTSQVVAPGPHGTLEVEYTLDVPGARVVVPAVLGSSSETIGVPRSAYQWVVGATLPPGFEYLGTTESEQVIARHERSGTSVVMMNVTSGQGGRA